MDRSRLPYYTRYHNKGPWTLSEGCSRQEVFPWDYYTGVTIKPYQNQRGNTPGHPAEFHFLGLPYYSKNHCNPEYVDIHADGAEIIKQRDTQLTYIGDNYKSLTYDIPFDPHYQGMIKGFLREVGYYTEDNQKYYPEPHDRYTSYY